MTFYAGFGLGLCFLLAIAANEVEKLMAKQEVYRPDFLQGLFACCKNQLALAQGLPLRIFTGLARISLASGLQLHGTLYLFCGKVCSIILSIPQD